MTALSKIGMAMTAFVALGSTTTRAQAQDVPAIERLAHGAYVAAINSNDVDVLMADLTANIVYQSSGEAEIVGHDAVRKWAAAYMAGYRTKWDKTSIGFTVSGDWAFERYIYKSADTDRTTGKVTMDTGKGINVFHHDADGKWRVAIDGWSSDKPT